MAGMNLGASRLEAHVPIFRKTEAGFTPLDDFSLVTKGRMILPPLGPVGIATHAVAEHRETLSADANRLADKVVKKTEKLIEGQQR